MEWYISNIIKEIKKELSIIEKKIKEYIKESLVILLEKLVNLIDDKK